ncbi:hypothetical protein GGR57DRAFT_365564 [Xylariaceae sp. FL1272]|nr:hypothetical protein GGR57DRAFT_365564 [Xylariaceae sp. FL1272]
MSEDSAKVATLAPFRKGDQFELPVPGTQYYPDHPRMQQLVQLCTDNAFDEFKQRLSEWQREANPSPPRGLTNYPMGPIEPCLYHAIRLDRAPFVACLLDEGVKMSHLAAWEAVSYKCSPLMWQVFVDHGGFDINAPIETGGLPPLGFVLEDETMVRWFLAQGADPNAESHIGLTPFLKAAGWAPLSTVRLLHEAGGSPLITAPFVCSPFPPRPQGSDGKANYDSRLEVLQYLLDAGADPNAQKWAHNSKGYASDFDWGSGLNAAIAGGHVELAQELLKRGARTDARSLNLASRGETALELAARYTPDLLPLVKECREKETEQS